MVKFRPFDKVECCLHTVAVFGNNVERNLLPVASTLLLVWTGL